MTDYFNPDDPMYSGGFGAPNIQVSPPNLAIAPPTLNQRFNGAVDQGLGRITNALFPVAQAPGMSPEQVQAARDQAMLRMGLGMMDAGSRPNARFGQALNAGYTAAANDLHGSMQNAYQNAMAQKQEDRQQKLMDNTLENTRIDNVRQQQQADAQIEANKLAVEDRKDQRKSLQENRDQQNKFETERIALERARLGLSAIPAGYRKRADGGLEFIPGGPADPAAAANNKMLRQIPSGIAKGIVNNRQQMDKIDNALAAVDANPDAFGGNNYLPDVATQRLPGKAFSGGVDARAKIADIGSLVLHDRSGAAVTASEFPRLKPFIPVATDDAKTVKIKLQNLRANISSMQEETEALYSPETGYRPIPKSSAHAQESAPSGWSIKPVQ